jgi:hypothetical protein
VNDVSGFRARVVVSGLDQNGHSTVVSDGFTEVRTANSWFAANDVWQLAGLPTPVTGDFENVAGKYSLLPPLGGMKQMVVAISPDSVWKSDPSMVAAALDAASAGDSARPNEKAVTFHQTDTVDIVTVISGEIYAVLESAEVCLRPGDTFVQRGTNHAWSNRTNEKAVIVLAMVSARR